MDTAGNTGQNHDAHHTYSKANCESLVRLWILYSQSKLAGESLAAPASSKQKPVHCTALIARKLNNKHADMDYHAVHPPGYKAGGDSKRERTESARSSNILKHQQALGERKRLEQYQAPVDRKQ